MFYNIFIDGLCGVRIDSSCQTIVNSDTKIIGGEREGKSTEINGIKKSGTDFKITQVSIKPE